ncbi:adenosine deaminase/editase [Thelonectria olida]|uniref:Adenosine deaminase/editase n=1 Tax=Thelonectria olida TaxID=1576542 RepID=A0A9P8W587_9HYPO|nr:adenosine deaminase/editase [Thelonectria olida]
MTSRSNLVARAVLEQFQKLPAKRKPLLRDNGLQEWVPLSGIVAERNGTLTCLALATGMKCLPASKIAESNGVGVHDWHAEILAIRTFNRFLLEECRKLLGDGAESDILRKSRASTSGDGPKPFEIRDDVKLHMYCSEAPCGDASMELTMAAQEDASPWQTPTSVSSDTEIKNGMLPGRAYFDQLGIVRRKPARGDAPPTMSKSCSDKIALKQCTSLLSSLTSIFIDPENAYIHSLILPESQYSATACRRAFSADGRMKPVVGRRWPGGYSFKPFVMETTDQEFEYSKITVQARSDKISASNLAAAWSRSGFEETILGGVMQGRKPFIPKGASRTSRRRMWESASDLSNELGKEHSSISVHLKSRTYQDIKSGPLLEERRRVKDDTREAALTGWIKNDGGSDFGIYEHGNH